MKQSLMQVVGHPHQDEQRVLLDFQALQPALVVENPPEVLKGKMRFWQTVWRGVLCAG